MLSIGYEPVTIGPLDAENNENENNGNKTVNILPLPNNDVEFEILKVQVQVSRSHEEDYYTTDDQEMQPDPDLNDHNLLSTSIVNYPGDVNAPANEVNRWERLPVDLGPH